MASPSASLLSMSMQHGCLQRTQHRLSPRLAPPPTGGAASWRRASRVVCSVSGSPKKATAAAGGASKAKVLRVEDPLAGRTYRPAMPGDEPDFWEGSQWDLLGFVMQYLWAFGIVLAAAASLYAVQNYSGGETPADGAGAGTEAQSEAASTGAAVPGVEEYPEDDAPPL